MCKSVSCGHYRGRSRPRPRRDGAAVHSGCVYTYMYIYVYICICICMCIYIYIHTYTIIYIYIYISVSLSLVGRSEHYRRCSQHNCTNWWSLSDQDRLTTADRCLRHSQAKGAAHIEAERRKRTCADQDGNSPSPRQINSSPRKRRSDKDGHHSPPKSPRR